jgi:hypothetical protein
MPTRAVPPVLCGEDLCVAEHVAGIGGDERHAVALRVAEVFCGIDSVSEIISAVVRIALANCPLCARAGQIARAPAKGSAIGVQLGAQLRGRMSGHARRKSRRFLASRTNRRNTRRLFREPLKIGAANSSV